MENSKRGYHSEGGFLVKAHATHKHQRCGMRNHKVKVRNSFAKLAKSALIKDRHGI